MKKIISLVAGLYLGIGMGMTTTSSIALPINVTIDFETNPTGDVPSYSEDIATITPTGGSTSLTPLTSSTYGDRGLIATGAGDPSSWEVRIDFSQKVSFSSITLLLDAGGSGGYDALFFYDAFLTVSSRRRRNGFNHTGIISHAEANAPHNSIVLRSVNNGLRPMPFIFSLLEITYEPKLQNIPEPTTLAILGLGLAGLGVMRRRRAANPH